MSVDFKDDSIDLISPAFGRSVPQICLKVKALENLEGSNASANQSYYVTVQVVGIQNGAMGFLDRK